MATNSQALQQKLDQQSRAAGSAPARKEMTVYDLLQQMRPQIARALPRHVSPDRMLRVALTAVRTTPGLAQCEARSLLAAIMTCAQLGLEPNTPLGHAYLIPFGGKVQLILGYRGLVELARRSGQLEYIVAREVCEGDEFHFEYGLQEKLIHKPSLKGRGKPYAYYGVAKFKDGGYVTQVMSIEEIERHRRRSKTPDAGPWVTDYDEMAKKTVIRAMARYLPLSAEFFDALGSEESPPDVEAEDGLTVDAATPESGESRDAPPPA